MRKLKYGIQDLAHNKNAHSSTQRTRERGRRERREGPRSSMYH